MRSLGEVQRPIRDPEETEVCPPWRHRYTLYRSRRLRS